ncbi:PBSX family phage terminase large subunit [Hydrogenoanaerobacterium sp.]|uniref:PBSX family phage terminase large subunit n=1 Tax=Hydrogenoanaerobacterium sp. TaxID=2953763 RepID=UPI00289C49A6|nr:PBSX family phage terminase large subunit [Hydrogenoanaerobacterium sp.]
MTRFKPFSQRQLTAMNWWCEGSPYESRDAIICDGAIRSGKTLSMSLGFVSWSMYCFEGASFAICGKTIASVRRNLIVPLLQSLSVLGFSCKERLSHNCIDICFGGKTNRYYLFGGRDEGSAANIQGITLAGILLDEVALMPRSFVEQAVARCSAPRSRFWFNCNPEHPFHWFYTEWIRKAEQKNALYLHFTMDDNLSLSEKIKRRYENMYSGVFYERFVLGKWVAAQGLIYPMFSEQQHVVHGEPPECERYYISCDYGTVNPMSMGLWGLSGGVWYRRREYYHNSRMAGVLKTDEEYYEALAELAGGLPVAAVIVDPSAASFIQCVRRHGVFRCIPAVNDVVVGIRRVSDLLSSNQLRFHESCTDCLREFSLYCWDDSSNRDIPKKENDHAMDELRYFVMTALQERAEMAQAGAHSTALFR